MVYIISFTLLLLSALFSGLTLGLLSLDKSELERKIKLGDKNAEKIYEVRKNGSMLLVTLLVGNVLVNAVLSVFLGSLMSGFWAVALSTLLIVLFGEILPQAFFAKHTLKHAPKFVPIVRVVMLITWPISYPISWVLEKTIGAEEETIWSRDELEEIIKDHEDSDGSDLDSDEQKIILGALEYSDKKAGEVMTYRDDCFLISSDTVLTESILKHIKDAGYSRIPVFKIRKRNIIGILYTKDLITLRETVPVSAVYRPKTIVQTTTDETLDDLLNIFIQEKIHMAHVRNSQNDFVGLITLEDILEEIIKTEISDETDND